MASLVLHLLTVFLGALFIFLGHVKLTPQLFPEYHAQMKNEFGKFNKEFPFHRQTGWRPYAKNYRLAVGITEVTCGFLLLFGNDCFETFSRAMSVLLSSQGFSQTLANIVLVGIMTNAIMTFQKLNYGLEYVVTSILIAFVLVLRLAFASRVTAGQTAQSTKRKAE